MSRPKSNNRDKAFKLWVKSGRTRESASIARELGISPGQVRKWKHLDAWDARPNQGRGAPIGNTNAKGNKGGGAPVGNSNGYKNGNYASMWMSRLETEQRIRMMKTETVPIKMVQNEIFLLEVREDMLMKSIYDIHDGWDATSKEERFEAFQEEVGEMLKFEDGVGKMVPVTAERIQLAERKIKEPQKLERLLSIQNTLNNVQGRKLRFIQLLDQFSRNELTDEELRLRISRMQLEVKKLKEDAW